LTEIRTIREAEAETFLDLLCTVFSLDYNRARGIFFTEPLFDISRKWALFEGDKMLSILTTSPLIFGWGRAFGIAGVATRLEYRGEGHASRLLERVYQESAHRGETAGLLFAREQTLYSQNGYRVLDRVIRAPIEAGGELLDPETMEQSEVQLAYEKWSKEHRDRLRRDERRWNYWNWHFRICTPFQGGYVCAEPGVLREAVHFPSTKLLPVVKGTEWFGTRTMAREMNLKFIGTVVEDLHLMGRNFPGVPQMFMTDQF
jgi:GNAT superfamily N-acetyltransferase